MKKINYALVAGLSALTLFTSCKKDDETPDLDAELSELKLNINGLQDLGENFRYEGWIMVDGSPVSAGIFDVNSDGELSKAAFNLPSEQLSKATAYILTIEPAEDPDPAPSDVHILAGEFTESTAAISVEHEAALGNDFLSSSGKYILATPTDGGSDTDELSGVWWLDPISGPSAGLNLPVLPKGWKYEGWAVINDQPVSTGTFLSVEGSDDFSGFSGLDAPAPDFPGEDFLQNAPEGFTFPTNLNGGKVVISIEPVPDNSPAPFVLKPLLGKVLPSATDHTPYAMDNMATETNPVGTVSR